MRTMFRHTLFLVTLAARLIGLILIGAFWLAAPLAIHAATNCCRCTLPADPQKQICIQTLEADCTKLPVNSKFKNIKELNCTDTDPICKAVALGGTCMVGPVEESKYNVATPTAEKSDQEVAPIPLSSPTLNIAIPGLTFAESVTPKNGIIGIPFIAQYISAVYNFLIGAAILAAAIMLVVGGFLYISGQAVGSVSKGREIIIDAVIGLILVLGANLILKTINPSLITLPSLRVTVVKRAADAAYLDEHGTTTPEFASAVDGSAVSNSGPAVPPPPFTGETVSIADIPFDKSKGGPVNLNNYTATQEEKNNADSYDKKIKLLVRAVLGTHKVCAKNLLCAYCQTCGTNIPGGTINQTANTGFILNALKTRSLATPEEVYGGKIPGVPGGGAFNDCIEIYYGRKTIDVHDGKNVYKITGVNALPRKPECTGPARSAYDVLVLKKMVQGKFFGGDCVATVNMMYALAGPTYRWLINLDGLKDGKGNPRLPASPADVEKIKDNPGIILASRMDEDLNSKVAQKGGMKFGDIVYILKGPGEMHVLMYTGGRPDVPFAFIEMGSGASVSVPGINGTFSGVTVKPLNWTLQDYINAKIKPQPRNTDSGQPLYVNKAGKQVKTGGTRAMTPGDVKDPHNAIVVVWRGYPE